MHFSSAEWQEFPHLSAFMGKRLSRYESFFPGLCTLPSAAVIPKSPKGLRHLCKCCVINRLKQLWQQSYPFDEFAQCKKLTHVSANSTSECSTCGQPPDQNPNQHWEKSSAGDAKSCRLNLLRKGCITRPPNFSKLPNVRIRERTLLPIWLMWGIWKLGYAFPFSCGPTYSLIAAMVSAMSFSSFSRAASTS